MEFFKTRAAFNINWREEPERRIDHYIPKGRLTKPGMAGQGDSHADWYADFPHLSRGRET